jgi:putative flavoprotein involved in K+ transport
MPTVHTLVVGAGQAGLATSHCLHDAGVDHVVLERGRPAERWRSRSWEALRLLTPNWATRLPGWRYRGPHADGFMSAAELADHLAAYAESFAAPIEQDSAVRSITRDGEGFTVRTGATAWRARNVVVATGWCDRAHVPGLAAGLAADVVQLTPDTYVSPRHLPAGGVLVVGGGASGVQLADELARSGRDVVLASGRHSRLPRRYRGMDIWWWLERIGTFAVTIDDVGDPVAARREAAVQLIGRDDHRDVDLPALASLGVEVVGRVTGADGDEVRVADDLADSAAAADQRLRRLLDQIDAHATAHGLDGEVLAPTRPRPTPVGAPRLRLDLRRRGIGTVVWATGYRRETSWLRLPVFDRTGEIAQHRGITAVDGLYVVGQRFQHRRDSNFIDGVRHDAAFVARQIAPHHRQPQLTVR